MAFAALHTVTEDITDPARWREWGGLGVFVAGVLNTSVLPIPGVADALTLLLAAAHSSWWPYYAALAAAGSVGGGFITYELGRKSGKEALEKKFSSAKMQRVYRRFDRWGFGAVFVPAMLPPPVPIVPFLLGAGAMNYPRRSYLLALALGRSIRFSAVALLGAVYGRQILALFSRYYEPILYVLLGLAAGGVAALLLYLWHLRNKQKEKKAKKAKKRRAA
jgi:membrane protein DedA with SNARE-associated domain